MDDRSRTFLRGGGRESQTNLGDAGDERHRPGTGNAGAEAEAEARAPSLHGHEIFSMNAAVPFAWPR